MEGSVEMVACVYCKTQIDASLVICPKCGATQRQGFAPPPSVGAPSPARPKRQVRWEKARPTGVTVTAVLMLIDVFFGFVGAMSGPRVGYLMLFIALFKLVLAVGLLYMQPWARIVAIVVNLAAVCLIVLAMIGGAMGAGALVSFFISGFVAFYLLILGPEFADYFED